MEFKVGMTDREWAEMRLSLGVNSVTLEPEFDPLDLQIAGYTEDEWRVRYEELKRRGEI